MNGGRYVLKSCHVLRLYLMGYYVCVSLAKLEICFPDKGIYKRFHPLKEAPSDPAAFVYSLSVGMMMLRPIIAQLCEEGGTKSISPTHLDYSSSFQLREFTVESLNPEVAKRKTTIDPLKGKLLLCYYSSDKLCPNRMPHSLNLYRNVSRVECADILNKNVLKIKFYRNLLVAQGLFHKMVDTTSVEPEVERVIRFAYITKHGRLIHKDTEPIKIITEPATGVHWIKQPPFNASALRPYEVALEIIDKNGVRVKTGFDSSLYVKVTIHQRDDLDGHIDPKVALREFLTFPSLILRQRATSGIVKFANLRFPNKASAVYIKATLIEPKTEITRYDSFEDGSQNCFQSNDGITCHVVSLDRSLPVNGYQTATKLTLVEPIVSRRKATARFKIPVILVQVRDKHNTRVTSGPDSSLVIIVKTDPQAHILANSRFMTNQGLGKFRGVINESIENLRFVFKASAINATVRSSAYNITNDINIVLYADLSKPDAISPHALSASTFVKFAVEDINKGMYNDTLPNLRGKSFKLEVIDTQDDFAVAADTYSNMVVNIRGNKLDVKAVIGFGSDEILMKMEELLKMKEFPIMSYTETTDEISEKRGAVKLVNSVRWNSVTIGLNLILMMKSRKWEKIVIITTEHMPLPEMLCRESSKFGIKYHLIIIPHLPRILWTENGLRKELQQILMGGSKIIFHYILFKPFLYYFYRQVVRFGYTTANGYQWITVEPPDQPAWWASKLPICQQEISLCNDALQGMIFIRGTYQIRSSNLFYIHQKYFGMDRVKYDGIPTSRTEQDNTLLALAYDAVLTLAHGFNAAYGMDSVPINTIMLSNEMQKVKFDGLTGSIAFADHRRTGFNGDIYRVTHDPENLMSWKRTRLITIPGELDQFFSGSHEDASLRTESTVDYKNSEKCKLGMVEFEALACLKPAALPYEIPVRTFQNLGEMKYNYVPTSLTVEEVSLPRKKSISTGQHDDIVSTEPTVTSNSSVNVASSIYSLRYYLSKKVNSSLSRDEPTRVLRTEYYLTTFRCHKGCGGCQLHMTDPHTFEHGVCIAENECRCKTVAEYYQNATPITNTTEPAFWGPSCLVAACYCTNGYCVRPNQCVCYKGWEGIDCSTPICSIPCEHGECKLPDYCNCDIGYLGETCDITVATLVAIVLAVLSLGLLFIYLWKKCRNKSNGVRRGLKNLQWLVNWEEVIEKPPDYASCALTPRLSSEGLFNNKTSNHCIRPQMTIVQLLTREEGTINTGPVPKSSHSSILDKPNQPFKYVIWRDQECYVQNFDRPSLNLADIQMHKEVAQLRQICHHNLVRFIGACITWPNVCILVEIIPKGSLDQILAQKTFDLTWFFKYSIMQDICAGMEYLHASSISSHGRLKSSNCLIDNRWSCKISGFGVPSIRNMEYSIYEFKALLQSMLWTAPELLREYSTPSEVGVGTKFGDMYSFGIIITEMCSHETPWSRELEILTLNDLIQCLKSLHDSANERAKELIKDLLNEDWAKRPLFKEVSGRLQAIHPLMASLVEKLICMLEEYTNHMQDMLDHKLREVKLEKTKKEELIARLLPESIAEQLKQNKQVEPQIHDNVTIFFSDIKGFTSIAKDSTPMQVVMLLNELYIMFDSVIERYNAYKLETIGDAYCVVSGIPVPNQNHAEDIVSMAMEITAGVNHFHIRHLPGRSLECRIGINSGSIVAGVLGVKMPRYCIFGIDVVIASQMESSGESKKVHISANTAKYLFDSEKFYLEFRGEIEIKYVGVEPTYFVKYRPGYHPPVVVYPSISHQSTASSSEAQSEGIKSRRKSPSQFVVHTVVSAAKSVESSLTRIQHDYNNIQTTRYGRKVSKK